MISFIRHISFLLLVFSVVARGYAQSNKDVILGDSAIIGVPKSYFSAVAPFSFAASVGSWVLRSEDRNYSKRIGDSFLKKKNDWYDTPMALLPAASAYALKLAGVESKSTWQRLLVSNSSSAALATGLSALLKSWTTSVSPDGSSRHSFPSDHAIAAFASAAILDEEYGHISPWVTVGGYGMASLASLLRINHNKHWIGDVVHSFNFGNAVAKAGYMIGDILTAGNGINFTERLFYLEYDKAEASFLSAYSSAVVSVKHFHHGNTTFYMKSGYASGLEGAWFFNSHFGIGGRTGVSYFLPKINNAAQSFSMDYFDAELGLYFASHLKGRWFCGAHLLGGGHWLTSGDKELRQQGIRLQDLYGTTIGASLDYTVKKNLSSRFFVDYSRLFDDFRQQRISVGISTCYNFR